MNIKEIKQELIGQGIYDKIVKEYNATHTNGIPNTAVQKRIQEVITKYNIEKDALDDLFGL